MTPPDIFRIWQAEVARWHHSTDHRLRNSGDGIQAHQARVAQLVALIFPDCTKEDLLEALTHDIAESWTGDISYEAKKVEVIRSAHDWAEADTSLRLGLPVSCNEKVKLCDGLDAILWCASRAPDALRQSVWIDHISVVRKQAWAIGVGAQIEGIFQSAGVR